MQQSQVQAAVEAERAKKEAAIEEAVKGYAKDLASKLNLSSENPKLALAQYAMRMKEEQRNYYISLAVMALVIPAVIVAVGTYIVLLYVVLLMH